MEVFLAVLFTGLVIGLIVGATGVGGGSLMTPVLIFFYNFNPVAAVATDLIFALVTKLVAATTHQKRGKVNWTICKLLWLGSLPAAFLGAVFLGRYAEGSLAQTVMPYLISAVVFLSAISLISPRKILGRSAKKARDFERSLKRYITPLAILVGIIMGVLVSFTSVGAGVLGTVALIYLYPHRMTASAIVATDTVHAIPLALIAGATYMINGQVDWEILIPMLAGSIPGAFLGARLVHLLPEKLVRNALAVVLCAAALMILLK